METKAFESLPTEGPTEYSSTADNLSSNGKNLSFIQTDNGTDIGGTAQQQFPPQ